MGTLPLQLASHALASVSDRDGVKYTLDDDSWLLIRPSGTEPVLRIYAEGRTEAQVKTLLTEGADLAQQQIDALG
jgi:phosphomannomutase